MWGRAALFMAVVAVAVAHCGRRGGPSTPEEARAVVEQAVAAHGGRENLTRLRNFKAVSRGRFKDRIDFRKTLLFRAPDAWVIRVEAMGGVALAYGVDGDRCWRRARLLTWPCSASDRKEYARVTDVLGARLLLPDPREVSPAGTVDLDGKAAPAVRVGDLVLAFDPLTHLLAQARYDEGWVESFGEYRLVDGARVSARRTLTIRGQPDVDETWETTSPGDADAEELRPPPSMQPGVLVDDVDPERLVAWTETDDLEGGGRQAIEALTRFVESKGRRLSASDGVVFGVATEPQPAAGQRWRVAISLEADAPLTPLTEGALHLETWPARRLVGVFFRGDPRTADDARAAVLRHLEEARVTPVPHADWQILLPPQAATEPFATRLSLLSIAVAPR